MNSENYRVKIFPGSVSNGVYHENLFGLAAVYGAPIDGYLVGKASPGDVLAITMVRHVKDKGDILGQDFVPCRDLKTMVFTVPDKPVIYLGDVSYEQESGRLRVNYADHLDAAAGYLASHYPKLSAAPERVAYDLKPTTLSCTQTIVVPVYVGR